MRLGVLIAAAAAGGCSMSTQSYFADTTPTGSITAKSHQQMPPERDLAFARRAAREVLRKGEKDASLDWENPDSGARGTVTPIASAYTQDGQTCRDFLASYVTKTAQSWLQGEACDEPRTGWRIRALKPWKSS